jgi:hypothetical protein
MDILEQESSRKIERKAEYLYENYRDKIDSVVNLFDRRNVRQFSRYDAYALGQMLENFQTWYDYIPESIAQDNLGKVLPVALDLISASYATSIMPTIASIQPIEDKVGVIFYKKMLAGQDRQGVHKGDVLLDQFGKRNWLANADYASDKVYRETFCTLPDGGGGLPPETNGVYSKTLAYHPALARTVTLEVFDESEIDNPVCRKAIDDGEGNLYGPGIQGTINYTTGEVSFKIYDNTGLVGGASGTGDYVKISYNNDIEQLDNIPKISWQTVHDTIEAIIFMLAGDWGIVTEYALQKRFGRTMDEEVAADLVSEINAEVATSAIREIVRNCPNFIDWSATPPVGTSAYEHKLSFIDAIETASTKIHDTAGRGTVNYMLASSTGLVYLATQPGFRKVATGTAMGPQVYGFLNDNITIIKVPGVDLVAPNTIYCGYRGMNWFEAAVVYSPYLPLFVTDTVAIGSALRRERGVAHSAGIKVVAPVFTTKINITTS